jgi:molybdopterin converting factor subunit 1
MRVQLVFFALYRDLTGAGELDMELPEGATVRELVSLLRARDGDFGRLPPEPAVAVNASYASHDDVLHDGDEVAFLPPVAGG